MIIHSDTGVDIHNFRFNYVSKQDEVRPTAPQKCDRHDRECRKNCVEILQKNQIKSLKLGEAVAVVCGDVRCVSHSGVRWCESTSWCKSKTPFTRKRKKVLFLWFSFFGFGRLETMKDQRQEVFSPPFLSGKTELWCVWSCVASMPFWLGRTLKWDYRCSKVGALRKNCEKRKWKYADAPKWRSNSKWMRIENESKSSAGSQEPREKVCNHSFAFRICLMVFVCWRKSIRN